MENEELELIIDRVKKGEIQHFSQLVVKFQKQLFNYIYCIVNNTQDAEDILQETFVTAIRKIHQYKRSTLFSAWLYRIARNLSFDTLKKRKRLILFERKELESLVDEESMGTTAYDGCGSIINEVFQRLTFKEKNILILRIYEEKSYEEIAYITKTGVSAARKQYERARKKFIQLYNQLNMEESLEGKPLLQAVEWR